MFVQTLKTCTKKLILHDFGTCLRCCLAVRLRLINALCIFGKAFLSSKTKYCIWRSDGRAKSQRVAADLYSTKTLLYIMWRWRCPHIDWLQTTHVHLFMWGHKDCVMCAYSTRVARSVPVSAKQTSQCRVAWLCGRSVPQYSITLLSTSDFKQSEVGWSQKMCMAQVFIGKTRENVVWGENLRWHTSHRAIVVWGTIHMW